LEVATPEINSTAQHILDRVLDFKNTYFKNLESANSTGELFVEAIYIRRYNFITGRIKKWGGSIRMIENYSTEEPPIDYLDLKSVIWKWRVATQLLHHGGNCTAAKCDVVVVGVTAAARRRRWWKGERAKRRTAYWQWRTMYSQVGRQHPHDAAAQYHR
jgi:hypothetical protein